MIVVLLFFEFKDLKIRFYGYIFFEKEEPNPSDRK